MSFTFRVWFTSLACVLILPALIAAQSTMSSPVLGFVFDTSTAGLRPILGVPGAARLADPIPLGFAISDAVVSPQQDSALAVIAEDRQLVGLEFSRSELRLHSLDGVRPGAGRIVFSPNGKSAALYYAEDRSITVLAGLPANPAIVAYFDAATIPGTLTALALHDDHATLLAGFSEGEIGSLFLFRPAQDPTLLSILNYPSAIRFLHRGQSAVVSDRVSNNVYYVTDVFGSWQTVFLASEQDGISTPTDIELSADDNRIVVAGNGSVTSIRLSDRSVQSYASEGAALELHRTRGKSVFLLNRTLTDPLLIFDGDSEEPRIVVVPPGAASLPAGTESGADPQTLATRRSPRTGTVPEP